MLTPYLRVKNQIEWSLERRCCWYCPHSCCYCCCCCCCSCSAAVAVASALADAATCYCCRWSCCSQMERCPRTMSLFARRRGGQDHDSPQRWPARHRQCKTKITSNASHSRLWYSFKPIQRQSAMSITLQRLPPLWRYSKQCSGKVRCLKHWEMLEKTHAHVVVAGKDLYAYMHARKWIRGDHFQHAWGEKSSGEPIRGEPNLGITKQRLTSKARRSKASHQLFNCVCFYGGHCFRVLFQLLDEMVIY